MTSAEGDSAPQPDPLARHALAVVAVLGLAQVMAWTLAPILVHTAPPIDVVEGYLWGHSWPLATYKHPALPAWVLEASRIVTGTAGWPAYVVSQLFVAATLACIFGLGRDLLGTPRALAATLMATLVPFFSWTTPEFNHNIAQMPLWAAFAWALWRAGSGAGSLPWIAAAAFAALALHAKFFSALVIAAGAVWLLTDRPARRRLAAPVPWLALALFVALVAPLAIWLLRHDFLPLRYAAERAHGRAAVAPLRFLILVALSNAGVLAAIALSGLARPLATLARPPAAEERQRRFLLVMAVGPAVAAAAMTAALDYNLRGAWSAPITVLIPLLLVAVLARRDAPRALRRLATVAAVTIVAVPANYSAQVLRGDGRASRPMLVRFPQRELEAEAARVWRAATDRPLRIVAGEMHTSGLATLNIASAPEMLSECRFELTPWITPDRLAREGALLVWTDPLPDRLAACRGLAGDRPVHEFAVPWRSRSASGVFNFRFVVVPPGSNLPRPPEPRR